MPHQPASSMGMTVPQGGGQQLASESWLAPAPSAVMSREHLEYDVHTNAVTAESTGEWLARPGRPPTPDALPEDDLNPVRTTL